MSCQNKNHHHIRLDLSFLAMGIILYVIAIFVQDSLTTNILYLTAFLVAGYHIILEGFVETFEDTIKAKHFKPNIHLLMTLAAIGAIIIGEYREAALLILIFAGAHVLEAYAQSKSQKEITRLLNLNPSRARRINLDGSTTLIAVTELKVDDLVEVLNGSQIPADGYLISGYSNVDESTITGESMPKEKEQGDFVYAGTMNGTGTFHMRVSKESHQTVFAKIIELVSQTQTDVSKTATLIKRIEPIYVTIILLTAPLFFLITHYLIGWSIGISFYRTMVYLIVASPCALAATDIPATLSAISNLAKRGILFKGGSYLSNISDIKAIAFDKTGTLTEGKPTVTDVYFLSEQTKQRYIDILVAMESKSNHPLATALLNHFKAQDILDIETTNIIGKGLKATYDNKEYIIGTLEDNHKVDSETKEKAIILQDEAKTVIYMFEDRKNLALIAIQDQIASSAKPVIDYFRSQDIHTAMITGDAKHTGEAVLKSLDMDQLFAHVLPEDKSNIIKQLKNDYGAVMMLGDGINDAPALTGADIGIAMGQGTDIAIDVADAVLMKNDLNQVIYMHKISKKLRNIVWQNIIFAMAVVISLIMMNILGLMDMPIAVLMHEGSTVVVILNGLRLLRPLK